MKITMKLFMTPLVLLSLVFTSCDGEDGINGLDGAIGPEGLTGQDGNANVVSVLLENQTINNGLTIFDVPQLTQEIFDTGFVYAYVTNRDDRWEALPITFNQEVVLEIDRISLGQIILQANFTQSNLSFRFVLVEGTDASGIDFNNYEELQSHYNLKD